MDRLHSMRVFSRVIDSGSFAGAARELNLSPAVVTRLVADLEEHLGARLINRTTRRLALTDIGEAYLERARQILTEVEEAEALASTASSEPRDDRAAQRVVGMVQRQAQFGDSQHGRPGLSGLRAPHPGPGLQARPVREARSARRRCPTSALTHPRSRC